MISPCTSINFLNLLSAFLEITKMGMKKKNKAQCYCILWFTVWGLGLSVVICVVIPLIGNGECVIKG